MGIVLWITCGAGALAASRAIPPGRGSSYVAEAIAAVIVAFGAGVAATALDFGGWNELNWRAGAFVLACAFAGLACVRVVRLASRSVA